MKDWRLTLSLVLILLALGLGLNVSSLNAIGIPEQERLKNEQTLPPQQINKPASTRIKEKDQPSNKSHIAQPQPSNTPESAPVGKPATDAKTESTTKKPENSLYDGFAPQTWAAWGQVLVGAGGLLVIWLTLRAVKQQAYSTEKAANAAKESSDAVVVASMPILSQWIVFPGTKLHPLQRTADLLYPSIEPIQFRSIVHFVFENFGKTPGAIRDLRADLFLTPMNEFPVVQYEQLPFINYQPIVPGESRRENALMGVAECEQEFRLTPGEFEELLAPGGRRFTLIGRVIYDDFFGNRHIRKFCVKMRRTGRN